MTAAGFIVVQSQSESGVEGTQRAIRETQYASCNGGNLRSSYELANHSDGPERVALAHDVLPIINCKKLIRRGERVPVPLSVQREYIRIVVKERMQPLLDGDVIIGVTQLPGALQDP